MFQLSTGRFEEGGAQAFGSKGPVVLKRLADYEVQPGPAVEPGWKTKGTKWTHANSDALWKYVNIIFSF